MSEPPPAEAIFGCRPNLLVRDLSASLRFYAEALGFRVGWRWSDPQARFLDEAERAQCAEPGTALVGRDGAQLLLTQRLLPIEDGAHFTWLHLDVHTAAQVDELCQEWHDRGTVIAELPVLRPWGMYEMRLADPDGNLLRISAPPA